MSSETTRFTTEISYSGIIIHGGSHVYGFQGHSYPIRFNFPVK